MIAVFSSSEATALANVLFFGGLVYALLRACKVWVRDIGSRFSRAARKAQQAQLLKELEKVASYKLDRFAALTDTAYGLFDEFLVDFGLVTFFILAYLGKVTID